MLVGIITLVCAAVVALIAFAWVKWLRDDNAETRENVIKWMKVAIGLNVAYGLFGIINAIRTKVGLVNAIVNACFSVYFSYYFFTVARRYHETQ